MIPDEEVWPEAGQPELERHDAADADFALDRGGRLKKAATAFRTISEVADDLHVPQHVLRFWETRFPQVKPLKRGGGRRYYRPDDVVLLRRISDLLYIQGYTIKGVQRLLLEGNGTLAGELPPPDAADRDEGAAALPLRPGAGTPGFGTPGFGTPGFGAVAGRAEGYGIGSGEQALAAASGPPGAPDLAASAGHGLHDIHALREALGEILAGLEAMRRHLPV